PGFTLVDETSARALRDEARRRVLTSAVNNEDPGLARSLAVIAGRIGEGRLADLLREMIEARGRLAALREGGNAIERVRMRFYELLGLAPYTKEEDVAALVCHAGAVDAAGIRAMAEAMQAKGGKVLPGQAAAMLAWLGMDGGGRVKGFEAYANAYFTKEGLPRDNMQKLFAGTALEGAFLAEMARLRQARRKMAAARVAQFSGALITVVDAVLAQYEALTRARGVQDFQDLIQYASQLLGDKAETAWVLFKLDGGIDHILLDEAQDTSPEQWRLVEALTEEFFAGETAREVKRTLFVVGDEKQSIYSFQGAEPAGFHLRREEFGQKAQGAGEAFESVALATSFRSVPVVLEAADAVFSDERLRRAALLEGALAHVSARPGQGGSVALWPLEERGEKEEAEVSAWDPPPGRDAAHMDGDARRRLARRIAKQIREWLENGEVLSSRGRALRAGDIMILVRRRQPFAGLIRAALVAEGVPVSGFDRLAITDHIAVQDVMSLARFALLPEDDLNLACLLKSPLVGVSEEALFELAYGRGEASLWERVRSDRATHFPSSSRRRPDTCEATEAIPQETNRYGQSSGASAPDKQPFGACRAGLDPGLRRDDEGKAEGGVADLLKDALALADRVTPYGFFAEMLEARGGRKKLMARFGAEVNDVLDAFLAQALDYEKRFPASLQGFLQWLETGRPEIKRETAHAGGEVRIITVHSAKGLQAPVVFLPDIVDLPDTARKRIFWLEDAKGFGQGVRLPFWLPSKEADCEELEQARREANGAEMEEYYRLLYVAMTRAEDRLILCGAASGKRNAGEEYPSWHQLFERHLGPRMNVVTEDGFELRRMESAQTAPPDRTEGRGEETRAAAEPPEFFRHPPPPEPVVPKSVAPSHLEEPPLPSPLPDALAFKRGEVIHRLLQFLPDLPKERRGDAAMAFLAAQPEEALPVAEHGALVERVLKVLALPGCEALFGSGSVAEAPITGIVDGRKVSGRIDRLVALPGKVMIVDYKTHRRPPARPEDVPAAVLRQQALYAGLLREIYPGKAVECYLLWTESLALQRVDRLFPAEPALTGT
ncbi:MAG: UvrD-helicase domain-containing protein, partial [Alphaproteobacteria bacterium]|nr:UvrD-helicase domain-containing protein [Alphaproteobacteria bacterium]